MIILEKFPTHLVLFSSWCQIVSNCVESCRIAIKIISNSCRIIQLLSDICRIVIELSICFRIVDLFSNCWFVFELLSIFSWVDVDLCRIGVEIISNFRPISKFLLKFCRIVKFLSDTRWIVEIILTVHLIYFKFIFTIRSKKSNISSLKFYTCMTKFSWKIF